MLRNEQTFSFTTAQLKTLKAQVLSWGSRFSTFLLLDSNDFGGAYSRYEWLAGIGVHRELEVDADNPLQALEGPVNNWAFGHLAYELKDAIEPKLSTMHKAKMGYEAVHFFVPRIVCGVMAGSGEFFIAAYDSPEGILQEIQQQEVINAMLPKLAFTAGILKEDYLQKIEAIRAHMKRGDCYELNFCNEGSTQVEGLDMCGVYAALMQLSPAPFAAFYRHGNKYMACASPERFIQREGQQIISQPIKGTARRGSDAMADEEQKTALRNSIKEQAENIMITDLVRNDLARCCVPGSIDVPELFGIYTFPQVHQMISTVSGQLKDGISLADIIRNTFPMGSMTGAPKVKVMELIERYEVSRRELFSGSVGYVTPDGDFDFNVVIRSLFYNEDTGYLGYQTGGAITYDSTAEGEWDELRLKAAALERIFS